VLALLLAAGAPARAQVVPGSGWTAPLNLSGTATSSKTAALVADPFGFLHVVWSEDVGGRPHPFGAWPAGGFALGYRRWAAGAWSPRVWVPTASWWGRVARAEAAVDAEGLLHVTWIHRTALLYSRTSVLAAVDPRAWAGPAVVEDDPVADARLLALDGGLLAVYGVRGGAAPGLRARPIADGRPGPAVPVWAAPAGAVPQFMGLAADGAGGVHVTWEVTRAGSPFPFEVRHAASPDGGRSWGESRVVARATSAEDALPLPRPWVAARGAEVHLQWAQGRQAFRWHQHSPDRGRTWSAPRRLWPDLVSQTESQGVAVAGDGVLYWADVLRYPHAVYLARWAGREWSPLEPAYLVQQTWDEPLGPRLHVHEIRLAVSLGHRLVMALQDRDRAEIHVMERELGTPPSAPRPVPARARAWPEELAAARGPAAGARGRAWALGGGTALLLAWAGWARRAATVPPRPARARGRAPGPSGPGGGP
jgi:hypothetical protein